MLVSLSMTSQYEAELFSRQKSLLQKLKCQQRSLQRIYEEQQRRSYHKYGANRRDPDTFQYILQEPGVGPLLLGLVPVKDQIALLSCNRALARVEYSAALRVLCLPCVIEHLLVELDLSYLAALANTAPSLQKHYQVYIKAQKPLFLDYSSLYPNIVAHFDSLFLYDTPRFNYHRAPDQRPTLPVILMMTDILADSPPSLTPAMPPQVCVNALSSRLKVLKLAIRRLEAIDVPRSTSTRVSRPRQHFERRTQSKIPRQFVRPPPRGGSFKRNHR